jgi:hypothetical protein
VPGAGLVKVNVPEAAAVIKLDKIKTKIKDTPRS